MQSPCITKIPSFAQASVDEAGKACHGNKVLAAFSDR
jgi:hypothetical protein